MDSSGSRLPMTGKQQENIFMVAKAQLQGVLWPFRNRIAPVHEPSYVRIYIVFRKNLSRGFSVKDFTQIATSPAIA
jgi:hypothetical protein